MSLKEQQDLLARLYTDPALQAEFFENSLTVVERYGLSDAEAIGFAALADVEVKFFADSLFAKRFREVQKALPLSARYLGQQFRQRFKDFAPTFNPVSVKKHAEDAIAFAGILIQDIEISSIQRDVIAFESTRLKHIFERRNVTHIRLYHDPKTFADPLENSTRSPGIALWLTPSKETRFTFIKLPFL